MLNRIVHVKAYRRKNAHAQAHEWEWRMALAEAKRIGDRQGAHLFALALATQIMYGPENSEEA
jgi:hypothetical protein